MQPNSLRRRDFCALGVTASLAAAARSDAADKKAAADQPRAIIDTHQHLWDLDRFSLPWLTDYRPLARSYSLDDYWTAARGVPIVKTVYMEVDVEPGQRQAEFRHVAALCKKADSRMAGAVVGAPPDTKAFAEYVQELKASGVVKGIRRSVLGRGSGNDFEFDKRFLENVRQLGENGLSFDINVAPDELARAASLVDQAPDTRFILDHCGNVDVRGSQMDFDRWKGGMVEVGKRKGIVCKISGFIANAKDKRPPSAEDVARVVDHVYECFGPERVMFGGDWPVCTLAMPLASWVSLLQNVVAARPAVDQRKLFHDNAAAFYGI